jgi:FMN phosphatase YigB (HAD superfamily)
VIQALLLDLDDTLLDSHFERFLPAYMSQLAAALEELGAADHIVQQLMTATQAMIGNLDPTRTLKQAFDARFYPALDTTEAAQRPTIDRFYEETYPDLQPLTSQIGGAVQLVEQARVAGLEVVIATNPLFPATAILQRLAWAGIPVDDPPFVFATSYERFHFTKPQPEYYAEVLGLLGVAPSVAAIVGDDIENDLMPAQLLGMATYHVSDRPHAGFEGGALAGAWPWLEAKANEEPGMGADLGPRAILARLRGHLAALLQRSAGLADETWRSRPDEREWAPVEIVCHLRDTEVEVYHNRLQRLLSESSPFLSAANPDQWAEERSYLHQDPHAALGAFVDARQETIAQLASLDDERWSAAGRHAILGPTTLLEQMAVAADHDLLHLAQLRETLGVLAQ